MSGTLFTVFSSHEGLIWPLAPPSSPQGPMRPWLKLKLNPNPHTVLLIPNRYGKRGACAGLSPSPTPSTRQPISHWWARWVSVACLGHVLREGTGRAGGGGPGGGEGGVRGVSAPHIQWTGPIHTKFYNFLIPYKVMSPSEDLTFPVSYTFCL